MAQFVIRLALSTDIEKILAIDPSVEARRTFVLEDQTQNLRIDSPGATLTNQPTDAAQKVLHARPGQRIELSYDIVPQQTEWFHHPQEHMAIISADYFLFNPQNALVYPEMLGTDEVSVTFDWRALPKNIPIITSFGIVSGSVSHRMIHIRARWIQVLDSLLAGGNFRISESKNVNGTTVALAIRGIWKFSDADALKDVQGNRLVVAVVHTSAAVIHMTAKRSRAVD